MKQLILLGAALGALALTACSKGSSSNNNNTAACTYNQVLGYSTDQNGNLCSTPSNCTVVGGVYVNPQTGASCNSNAMAGNCVMTASGWINQTSGQYCTTQTAIGGYSTGYGYAGASCDSYNAQVYPQHYYQIAYSGNAAYCVLVY